MQKRLIRRRREKDRERSRLTEKRRRGRAEEVLPLTTRRNASKSSKDRPAKRRETCFVFLSGKEQEDRRHDVTREKKLENDEPDKETQEDTRTSKERKREGEKGRRWTHSIQVSTRVRERSSERTAEVQRRSPGELSRRLEYSPTERERRSKVASTRPHGKREDKQGKGRGD